MLSKLPNITEASHQLNPTAIEPSPSIPCIGQPPLRAFSSTNITKISQSRRSISMQRASYLPSQTQLRENQLQWMFNRRKQKLIQTSVENYKLYNRIKRQKSRLGQYNKGAIKPTDQTINNNNYMISTNTSNAHIAAHLNRAQTEIVEIGSCEESVWNYLKNSCQQHQQQEQQQHQHKYRQKQNMTMNNIYVPHQSQRYSSSSGIKRLSLKISTEYNNSNSHSNHNSKCDEGRQSIEYINVDVSKQKEEKIVRLLKNNLRNQWKRYQSNNTRIK